MSLKVESSLYNCFDVSESVILQLIEMGGKELLDGGGDCG